MKWLEHLMQVQSVAFWVLYQFCSSTNSSTATVTFQSEHNNIKIRLYFTLLVDELVERNNRAVIKMFHSQQCTWYFITATDVMK
jgi:hypothetical protein